MFAICVRVAVCPVCKASRFVGVPVCLQVRYMCEGLLRLRFPQHFEYTEAVAYTAVAGKQYYKQGMAYMDAVAYTAVAGEQ